jgi:hypothetical protein
MSRAARVLGLLEEYGELEKARADAYVCGSRAGRGGGIAGQQVSSGACGYRSVYSGRDRVTAADGLARTARRRQARSVGRGSVISESLRAQDAS